MKSMSKFVSFIKKLNYQNEMKNIILVLIVFLVSCGPTSPPSSNNKTINNTSPEAEARILTDKMKSSLELDETQLDKVLMINVVNLKIIKKLKEANEVSKINSTKEKYKSELKEILTQSQFAKFLTDFSEL